MAANLSVVRRTRKSVTPSTDAETIRKELRTIARSTTLLAYALEALDPADEQNGFPMTEVLRAALADLVDDISSAAFNIETVTDATKGGA